MLRLTPPQSHGPVGILVRTHSVKVCIGLISVPLQDALSKFNSYYSLQKSSEKKVRNQILPIFVQILTQIWEILWNTDTSLIENVGLKISELRFQPFRGSFPASRSEVKQSRRTQNQRPYNASSHKEPSVGQLPCSQGEKAADHPSGPGPHVTTSGANLQLVFCVAPGS